MFSSVWPKLSDGAHKVIRKVFRAFFQQTSMGRVFLQLQVPPSGGHWKKCRFRGILCWLHFSDLKATCIDFLIQAYWWFWTGPRCECECQLLSRCVGPTTCPGVPRLLHYGEWDRLQRNNDQDKQKKTDGWMEARIQERRAHPLVWTWWLSSSSIVGQLFISEGYLRVGLTWPSTPSPWLVVESQRVWVRVLFTSSVHRISRNSWSGSGWRRLVSVVLGSCWKTGHLFQGFRCCTSLLWWRESRAWSKGDDLLIDVH